MALKLAALLQLRLHLVLVMLAISTVAQIDPACESGKRCLSIPDGCTAADCKAKVTIETGTRESGDIKFVSKMSAERYTAFAISKERGMPNSIAIVCLTNLGVSAIHTLFLIDRTPNGVVLADPAVPLVSSNVDLSTLECTFEVKLPLIANGLEFTSNEDLYLLIAEGDPKFDEPFINFHTSKKISDFLIWGGDTEGLGGINNTAPYRTVGRNSMDQIWTTVCVVSIVGFVFYRLQLRA